MAGHGGAGGHGTGRVEILFPALLWFRHGPACLRGRDTNDLDTGLRRCDGLLEGPEGVARSRAGLPDPGLTGMEP